MDQFENVQAVFKDVLYKHGRSNVITKTPYPATIMDLPLEDSLNIMPALDTKVIVNIAKQATSGDLNAMYTLSRMYTVGLGLPKSLEKAYAWAQHSLMELGSLTFKEAVVELKNDVRALKNKKFSYPEVLDSIYSRMIPHYEEVDFIDIDSVIEKGSYWVSPMYAGIRLFLIYRIDDESKSAYLYDVRAGGKEGERLSLDIAYTLNIPFVLGDIRYHKTIPDYLSRMKEHITGPVNYITVSGSLCLNPYKKKLIREALPEITKASQLFDYLVNSADMPRLPYVDTDEFENLSEKIGRTKQKIDDIREGVYIENLRADYESVKTKYGLSKRRNNHEQMQQLKKEAETLKKEKEKVLNPSYLSFLQTGVDNMELEFKSIKEENDHLRELHNAKYPENLFTFMATDIYHGAKGVTTPMPLGSHVYQHLESLGFQSFSTFVFDSCRNNISLFDGNTRDLKKYLKTKFAEYSKSEFNVSGLIIRNLKTVKKKQYGTSYICYF